MLFSRIIIVFYNVFFTVVVPAAWEKKNWASLKNQLVRIALFYTQAAFQKQPFPHFLSPQCVYLYSRPPPKIYDNCGNLLNQKKVYL